jgi:hypothetical protein
MTGINATPLTLKWRVILLEGFTDQLHDMGLQHVKDYAADIFGMASTSNITLNEVSVSKTLDDNQTLPINRHTKNPVYCVLDLMTNTRYGMGNYVKDEDIDFDSFFEAAKYCWELVAVKSYNTEVIGAVKQGNVTARVSKNSWMMMPNRGSLINWNSFTGANNIIQVGESNNNLNQNNITQINTGASKTQISTGARATLLSVESRFLANLQNRKKTDNKYLSREYKVYYEHRFELDYVIDTAMDPIDAIRTMLTTCRGILYFKNGKYKVRIEKPELPVRLITMGNIIENSFSSYFIEKTSKYNSFEIQFKNKDKDWRDDFFIVRTDDLIAGLDDERKNSLSLYGITRISQIKRMADYLLKFNDMVKQGIEFKLSVENFDLEIFDVIYFQHDVPEWSQGGRVILSDLIQVGAIDRYLVLLTDYMDIDSTKKYLFWFRDNNDVLHKFYIEPTPATGKYREFFLNASYQIADDGGLQQLSTTDYDNMVPKAATDGTNTAVLWCESKPLDINLYVDIYNNNNVVIKRIKLDSNVFPNQYNICFMEPEKFGVVYAFDNPITGYRDIRFVEVYYDTFTSQWVKSPVALLITNTNLNNTPDIIYNVDRYCFCYNEQSPTPTSFIIYGEFHINGLGILTWDTVPYILDTDPSNRYLDPKITFEGNDILVVANQFKYVFPGDPGEFFSGIEAFHIIKGSGVVALQFTIDPTGEINTSTSIVSIGSGKIVITWSKFNDEVEGTEVHEDYDLYLARVSFLGVVDFVTKIMGGSYHIMDPSVAVNVTDSTLMISYHDDKDINYNVAFIITDFSGTLVQNELRLTNNTGITQSTASCALFFDANYYRVFWQTEFHDKHDIFTFKMINIIEDILDVEHSVPCCITEMEEPKKFRIISIEYDNKDEVTIKAVEYYEEVYTDWAVDITGILGEDYDDDTALGVDDSTAETVFESAKQPFELGIIK